MFHFLKRKLRYYYISPLDILLDKHRKSRIPSPSQQYEIDRHALISKYRDSHPDYLTKTENN